MSGSIGIESEDSGSLITIIIVSNRFPAWLWNIGGCLEWCLGVRLVGEGCKWGDFVRRRFEELKVWEDGQRMDE